MTDRAELAKEWTLNLYSDAMDAAVTSFSTVGYLQRNDGHERSGEDFFRGQLSAAIKSFIQEIPESDLVRLARPPAPSGNGTTVGAQPVAQLPSAAAALSAGEGGAMPPEFAPLDFDSSDGETGPATISDARGDIICILNVEKTDGPEVIAERESIMKWLVAKSRVPNPQPRKDGEAWILSQPEIDDLRDDAYKTSIEAKRLIAQRADVPAGASEDGLRSLIDEEHRKLTAGMNLIDAAHGEFIIKAAVNALRRLSPSADLLKAMSDARAIVNHGDCALDVGF